MDNKKWSREAILCLIEAYRDEECLYAVNTPNYRNKHVRKTALQNVCDAVSIVKPGVAENECAAKFYNLRTQFNIENAKVKASIKSGASDDNVYKPSLWYFSHMKYLETYFTPRKGRNFIKKKFAADLLSCTQDEESSGVQFSDIHVPKEEWLEVDMVEGDFDKASNNPGHATKSVNVDPRLKSPTVPRPSPAISPATSDTSASGISSNKRTFCFSGQKHPKRLKSNNARPVITRSINQCTDNSSSYNVDPVDACMAFIGSMLKRLKNDKLKLQTMNSLIQTTINASSEDVQDVTKK